MAVVVPMGRKFPHTAEVCIAHAASFPFLPGCYLWRGRDESAPSVRQAPLFFSLLGRSSTAVLLAFRPWGPCNLHKKRSWCGAGLRQDRPPRAPILGHLILPRNRAATNRI